MDRSRVGGPLSEQEYAVDGEGGAEAIARPAGRRRFARARGVAQVPRRAELPRHIANDALRRRMLSLADVFAVLLATGAATLGTLSAAEAFWTAALLPVWIVLAKLHGLY